MVALAGLVVSVAAGCALPSNAPDDWGPRAEANVMEGCLASFDEDLGALVGVDDQGTTATDDDEVVIADGAPADQLEYCRCTYDGYVENLSFDTFKTLEEEWESTLESADGEGEELDVEDAPDQLVEIRDACGPPR